MYFLLKLNARDQKLSYHGGWSMCIKCKTPIVVKIFPDRIVPQLK